MVSSVGWSPGDRADFIACLGTAVSSIKEGKRKYLLLTEQAHSCTLTKVKKEASSLQAILDVVKAIPIQALTQEEMNSLRTSLVAINEHVQSKKAAWYQRLPYISGRHLAYKQTIQEAITPLIQASLKFEPERDENGRTTLHWAAKRGDVPRVKVLVGQGLAVTAKDDRRATPLHLASLEGHISVMEVLVRESPHAVHCQDNQGRTALYLAVSRGHKAAVGWLLDNNSPIDCCDEQGLSPLACALWDKIDIALLLINRGAKVERLKSFSPSAFILDALSHKALNVLEASKRQLLTFPSDLLPEIVRRRPQDVSSEKINTIAWILRTFNVPIGSKYEVGNTLLHFAQNVEDALVCVERGCKVSDTNNAGLTPLWTAVSRRNFALCRWYIVEKKADPFIVDKMQQNILHYAKDALKHNAFSRQLKGLIAYKKETLEKISAQLEAFLRQCQVMAARAQKKLIPILLESHGDYRIYQIEKVFLTVGKKLNITHFCDEVPAIIDDEFRYRMIYNWAEKKKLWQIHGVDVHRSTFSTSEIDWDTSGMQWRNLGITESIEKIHEDTILVTGADHGEGIVAKSGTRLNPKSFFVVPFNLIALKTGSGGAQFYADPKKCIQVPESGIDTQAALAVVRRWNS